MTEAIRLACIALLVVIYVHTCAAETRLCRSSFAEQSSVVRWRSPTQFPLDAGTRLLRLRGGQEFSRCPCPGCRLAVQREEARQGNASSLFICWSWVMMEDLIETLKETFFSGVTVVL